MYTSSGSLGTTSRTVVPPGRAAAKALRHDTWGRLLIRTVGFTSILLTLAIGAFLLYRGTGSFWLYGHSPLDFIISSQWNPADTMEGGGHIGAAMFIAGSLITCLLALIIATPCSISLAIFMTEIAPTWGNRIWRPVIEIFVGIPSIVYGWLGLTVLVPFIREYTPSLTGFSVLAAALVLALMMFPTVTAVTINALDSVPKTYQQAAYGLGATRWEVIRQIILPVAKRGILAALILGFARAFGEALAVAMVIGKMKAFPTSLFDATVNLTGAIAADMGNTMEGSEFNMALWSMALLLFVISVLFIFTLRYLSNAGGDTHD